MNLALCLCFDFFCARTCNIADMGDLYVEIDMFARKKGESHSSERGNDDNNRVWRGICTFSLTNHSDVTGDEKVTDSLYDHVFPIVMTPVTGTDTSSVTVVGGLALKLSTNFSASLQNEHIVDNISDNDADQQDEKIDVEPEVNRAHRSSFEMNEHRSEHDANLPIFPALNAGRTTPARATEKNTDQSRDATSDSQGKAKKDEAKASSSSSSLRRSIVGLKKRNSTNHQGRKMRMQRNAHIADTTFMRFNLFPSIGTKSSKIWYQILADSINW